MNARDDSLEELREMRDGVQRALLDIWRGARLVREGVDITEAHKVHLQSVVTDIDARIAAFGDIEPKQVWDTKEQRTL